MIALRRPLEPLALLAGHAMRLWFRTVETVALMPDGSVRSFDAGFVRGKLFAASERDVIGTIAVASRISGGVALVAPGNDGDWVSTMVRPLGVRVARGSSRREGAAGLRDVIEDLRASDAPAMIFVDGPLGPAGVSREGVVACARFTSRPIVPVAGASSRALTFRRSWAKHELPYPMSTLVAAFGEPIEVAGDTPREAFGDVARRISAQLAELRTRAEALLRSGRASAVRMARS